MRRRSFLVDGVGRDDVGSASPRAGLEQQIDYNTPPWSSCGSMRLMANFAAACASTRAGHPGPCGCDCRSAPPRRRQPHIPLVRHSASWARERRRHPRRSPLDSAQLDVVARDPRRLWPSRRPRRASCWRPDLPPPSPRRDLDRAEQLRERVRPLRVVGRGSSALSDGPLRMSDITPTSTGKGKISSERRLTDELRMERARRAGCPAGRLGDLRARTTRDMGAHVLGTRGARMQHAAHR